MARELTAKQQRFVDAYDGNATQAAADAGYKGNRKTLEAVGRENLGKPRIAAAIAGRESVRAAPTIATREERQQFWTDVMYGKHSKMVDGQAVGADWKDRLKAAELLGRSEADFVDKSKVEHSGGLNITRATFEVSE